MLKAQFLKELEMLTDHHFSNGDAREPSVKRTVKCVECSLYLPCDTAL